MTPEEREESEANKSLRAQAEDMGSSYGTAIIVAVINALMTYIVRGFSAFEKHETKTWLNISLASKLTLLRFLNTSVIYMIVHRDANRWYRAADLNADAFSVLIFCIFAQVITFGTHIAMGTLANLAICWEKSKGDASEMTQMQANLMLEGSAIDTEDNISNFMNMILSCMFYSTILPVAMPMALVGVILHYILTKYMLTRLQKMPDEFSQDLTIYFANLMPFVAVVWAVSYFIFMDKTAQAVRISNEANAIKFQNLIELTDGSSTTYTVADLVTWINTKR